MGEICNVSDKEGAAAPSFLMGPIGRGPTGKADAFLSPNESNRAGQQLRRGKVGPAETACRPNCRQMRRGDQITHWSAETRRKMRRVPVRDESRRSIQEGFGVEKANWLLSAGTRARRPVGFREEIRTAEFQLYLDGVSTTPEKVSFRYDQGGEDSCLPRE